MWLFLPQMWYWFACPLPWEELPLPLPIEPCVLWVLKSHDILLAIFISYRIPLSALIYWVKVACGALPSITILKVFYLFPRRLANFITLLSSSNGCVLRWDYHKFLWILLCIYLQILISSRYAEFVASIEIPYPVACK